MKTILFTVDTNLLLAVVLTLLVLSLFKTLIIMKMYQNKHNKNNHWLVLLYYFLEVPVGWLYILVGFLLVILDTITGVEKENKFDKAMRKYYTFYEKEE